MITLCNNAVKQLFGKSHQHWISKMGLLNLYCIASLKSKTLVAKLFSVSANQNEKEYDLIIVGELNFELKVAKRVLKCLF